MTVICDVLNCAYNLDHLCCKRDYIELERGSCKHLINGNISMRDIDVYKDADLTYDPSGFEFKKKRTRKTKTTTDKKEITDVSCTEEKEK